jgi:predicted nicotinamide N-methyase
MTQDLLLQNIHLANTSIDLYVPEPIRVKTLYQSQISVDASTPFPYWSQVWPAAIALAHFIEKHPYYIENKTVLELAAGLGLPSLVAARVGKKVDCTDYLPDAVTVMKQSVAHHQLKNMFCSLLDWNKMPAPFPKADVVLMSDINYNPTDFDILYSVLKTFLEQGSTLLLTTPQRLLAKPFVEKLMPWCTLKEEMEVQQAGVTVPITVLVLAF